jgi:hypothetical protein
MNKKFKLKEKNITYTGHLYCIDLGIRVKEQEREWEDCSIIFDADSFDELVKTASDYVKKNFSDYKTHHFFLRELAANEEYIGTCITPFLVVDTYFNNKIKRKDKRRKI